MRVPAILATVTALAAMLILVPSAGADQTFHTQRIPLVPVGSAPLRTGFVVDVHANGPQISSLERYVLNGAAPSTAYHVQLLIYSNASCSGGFIVVPTASFVTNRSGNSEGSWTFVPSDIPPNLHGTIIFIVWQVLAGDTVAYHTACIAVGID
jgi:hypothetical protein